MDAQADSLMHCFGTKLSALYFVSCSGSAGRRSIIDGTLRKAAAAQLLLLIWTFCPCAGCGGRYRLQFIIFILPPKDQFHEPMQGKRRLPICCILINMPPSGTIDLRRFPALFFFTSGDRHVHEGCGGCSRLFVAGFKSR